jgi:hypothetical protein
LWLAVGPIIAAEDDDQDEDDEDEDDGDDDSTVGFDSAVPDTPLRR